MDLRDFLSALGAAEPNSPGRERRFSDADRSSSLRPNFVAVSQASRAHPTTDEAPAECMTVTPPLQQHACQASVCAVLKAFETTELLEMILDNLCTNDVLRMRLISKNWNNAICKSPSLRLHFFVHSQWNRHPQEFQLLSLKIPGLSIEPGEDVAMGRWIHVRMTVAAARQISPPTRRVRSRSIFEGHQGGLGPRSERSSDPWPSPHSRGIPGAHGVKYESLYVTQPPILGFQAFVLDPPTVGPSEEKDKESVDEELCALAKLHCDSGINLGFLAETTMSLLSDPKPPGQQDHRSVLFKAIVSFATPNRAPGKQRSTNRTVTPIGS